MASKRDEKSPTVDTGSPDGFAGNLPFLKRVYVFIFTTKKKVSFPHKHPDMVVVHVVVVVVVVVLL